MVESREQKKGRYIALVPARGGSTGLPGKNMMEVQGISLVARAVKLGVMTPNISRVLLSSDDKGIIDEAKKAGCEIPFKRPSELSTSDTPMVKVLEHAVRWIRDDMHGSGEDLRGLVVLQPTSPMRRLSHIIEAVELYDELKTAGRDISGVISVSPVPDAFSPERIIKPEIKKMREAETVTASRPGAHRSIAGETLYYRNGAVIVLDPDCLPALNSFNPPVYPYVIHDPLVSIDSLFDLRRVEFCGRMLEPYCKAANERAS